MNKQQHHPDSGFSLLEVLISIIVVTFFTSVAMQMMLISATFKARAEDYARATNLIQKDLESIRSQASEFEFPTTANSTIISPPVPAAETTIPLTSVEYFTTSEEVQFINGSDIYRISSIDTVNKTITIPSPGIKTQIAANAKIVIVNNTLCNGSLTTGMGAKLKNKTAVNLTTIPSSLSSSYSGYQAVSGYSPYQIPNTQRKLWMIRQDTVSNRLPYDVLEVKYVVVKGNNSNPNPNQVIAEFSSEVLPNASFQCFKS